MGDEAKKAARRQALLEKFRSISAGRLERLNLALLELEKDPGQTEAAEEALREIHTLKGEAKLLGFAVVSTLAHKTEELLVFAQDRGFRVASEVFDTILAGFDGMGTLLQDEEGFGFDLELYAEQAAELVAAPDEAESPAPEAKEKPAAEPDPGPRRKVRPADTVFVDLGRVDRLTELVGDLVQDQARREQMNGRLRELAAAWREKLEQALDVVIGAATSMDASAETRRLRVERVRELLGEQRQTLAGFEAALAEQDEATFEEGLRVGQIEEGFREIRMRPLSALFGVFPRAVRDLAQELGKDVEVEVRGEAVAVDQRIHERIREPLLHLLRNAVDHGLETPAERRAAGKGATGRLQLVASQHGAHVAIAVADDGRGIDAAKLRRSAAERGLLSARETEEMNDHESLQLIFRRGLSTREAASEVSGRGIGMDVVKHEVEGLGGSIRVASDPGLGTSVHLVIPISLAFQRLLLLEEGGRTYGLPAASVTRLLRLGPEDVRLAAGSEVFDLESEVLPLVDLAAILGGSREDAGERRAPVMVLGHGTSRVGLRVSSFLGERALVHKNLDPFLDGVPLVSGAAFQGDGRPVLILSVPEVVTAARVALGRGRRAGPRRERRSERVVLVVDDSELTRVMLVEILRGLGHRVLEAANGRQAVEALVTDPADLVLLDLDMPVMDGFEFLEALRSEGRHATLPVVVFSARGSEEDKRRCLELGADAYLVKSAFQEADLVRTVGRFLD